jgi:putative PIN family toxin of toxin-antitoxin system
MMRIVVDTNVIISALVFGGLPREVLDGAAIGVYSLYFSPPIQAEVKRILKEKFGWSAQEVQVRTAVLWKIGVQVHPKVPLDAVPDDPDDNRVLECALAAGAHAIVSGDRQLLRLGSFESIPIQTARHFLESRGWESPWN